MATSPRQLRRVLRRLGMAIAGLAALVAIALLLLSLVDLKHPLERMAAARFGRTVVISGRLEAHVWSSTPGVIMTGLTVGNPGWERSTQPMLQAQRLLVRVRLLPLLTGRLVLERLEIDQPQIYLHRDAQGRANWTLEREKPSNEPAGRPMRLPPVRALLIRDGKLKLLDEILHLDVQATMYAHEQGTGSDPQAFRVAGQGTVNRQPLRVALSGGPLISLQPGKPYPLALRLDAGDVHVESEGVIRKPFDLGQLGFTVRASGNDLADFYYLTQLAFPNTPPFRLQAAIDRDGARIRIAKLSGQVGTSDLQGTLEVNISRKRPAVSGTLTSERLRLSDLAESLGGRPRSTDSSASRSLSAREKRSRPTPPQAAPASQARVFPLARLQVNRVRAMNADVHFTATSVEAGSVPLKQVALHIRIDDGVLSLDPLELQLPQGRLQGTAVIDARGTTPATKLDLRLTNIQLDQFKGKSPSAQAPLAGELQARVLAHGSGDSVHDFAAGADGTVTFVLPHGEINAAFAELTGIDVAEGLGLLLKGAKQREDIRCGVAEFGVQDGAMRVQNLVVDTQDVRITGAGEVRLGPEELDLTLKGQPKKFRLARLKAPVTITGHLLRPAIGIKAAAAVKQGAIATALGAALTPIAAVIAFVDPGLAKDENCAALLGTAEHAPGAPQPSGTAKD